MISSSTALTTALIRKKIASAGTSKEHGAITPLLRLAIAPPGSSVAAFWRTIEYEEVYLQAYAPVREATAGIGRYINFYNLVRPHSTLVSRTPDQLYNAQPLLAAA